MQFSEKRAIVLLASTFALIAGLTVSPSLTQGGSAYAASSSSTTLGITVSYTTCMPNLEEDLAATDASFDVTDSDSLEDLDETDALDWQEEYMFNFSEYALCVARATAGHDIPTEEADLISADYIRLGHVGIMLYLLADDNALEKLGVIPTRIETDTTERSASTKSTTIFTQTTTTKTRSEKSTEASDDTSTPGKKDSFSKTPLGKFLLCFAEIFGAVSIWEILDELKKQGVPNPRDCMRNAWCRKKILKILKKWASRLLGFWGLALLLVDLGICAYLYATDDG